VTDFENPVHLGKFWSEFRRLLAEVTFRKSGFFKADQEILVQILGTSSTNLTLS
jgi:hypothetical protein